MKRSREARKSTLRNGDVLSNEEVRRSVKRHKPLRHRPENKFTTMNLQRRVIRFSPNVEAFTIANRRQISVDERKERWITGKEFRRLRKEHAKLIQRIETSSSSKHDFFSCLSTVTDLEPPPIGTAPILDHSLQESDDSSDNDTTDCTRGLEQQTKLYLGTKIALQRLFHETIQRIELLEKQNSKDYSEILAQLCQVCSATAVANALVLGARDAEEVGHHDHWILLPPPNPQSMEFRNEPRQTARNLTFLAIPVSV